jgi:hypothetical protein
MRLKELKDWIETLPSEFLNFDVVNAKFDKSDVGEGYSYRIDNPVTGIAAIEGSKEILILNYPPLNEFSLKKSGYEYSKFEINPLNDEQLDN